MIKVFNNGQIILGRDGLPANNILQLLYHFFSQSDSLKGIADLYLNTDVMEEVSKAKGSSDGWNKIIYSGFHYGDQVFQLKVKTVE